MDTGGDLPRRAIEKLDIEDEEERQNRIQSVLEKLNTNSSKTPDRKTLSTIPSYDFGDRTTYEVKPPTELLSRLQAFLPELQASNSILAQRAQADPRSVDIEHLEADANQYIEMNLGLGVFEERGMDGKGHQTHEEDDGDADMSGDSSDSLGMDDDDDDDDGREQGGDRSSEWDSDVSSVIITSVVYDRPMKPLPKRARPQIVVLDQKPS